MKSLRAQLLAGLTIGVACVCLAAGAALYVLIRQSIRAEFDQALASKARALAALVENNEDGLEFELTEAPLPEFAAGGAAEYFQIWRPDGSLLARSASLAGGDLERSSPHAPSDDRGHEAKADDAPAFGDVALPDGRPGRVVTLCVEPRRDAELGPAEPPVRVVLALGRSTAGVLATLGTIRALLIGVGAAALLLAIVVAAWVVRRSLRPVDELGRQIGGLDAGGLAQRIAAGNTPAELTPVVERLNGLLARLEAAFERERRFTGDVAHELRTPLAGLRSKLELALSRDRTPEAYQAALRDCLAIDQQMQRMVETLLSLARADAGLRDVRREDVDVSRLIRECWRPLEERALARRLTVEWRLDGAGTIRTDRDRLALVIGNVLDNAVAHADEGGRAVVATSSANGALQLTVTNTGSRVTREQVQHVFDRFWRGDASRPFADGHLGLGLPLCRALIEGLGGSIRAEVSDSGEFTIATQLRRAE